MLPALHTTTYGYTQDRVHGSVLPVLARIADPYRPGSDRSPATLAGRQEVLEDLVDALETAALDHRAPRPVMLLGSRGMGKTVLLGEAGARAGAQFGWPRVHVKLRPGGSLIRDLIERLDAVRRVVEQQPARRGLRAQSATLRAQLPGVGGEVRFERAPEHSVTYFERAAWHELEPLGIVDAALALSQPAEHAGRPMDDDAAELLADASGGYPFAIQLYGHTPGAPRRTRTALTNPPPRGPSRVQHANSSEASTQRSVDRCACRTEAVHGGSGAPNRLWRSRHRSRSGRSPRSHHSPGIEGPRSPHHAGHAHRGWRCASLHGARHGGVRGPQHELPS